MPPTPQGEEEIYESDESVYEIYESRCERLSFGSQFVYEICESRCVRLSFGSQFATWPGDTAFLSHFCTFVSQVHFCIFETQVEQVAVHTVTFCV